MSLRRSRSSTKPRGVGAVIGGLYGGIVIMQVAIIAGAWFAKSYGSMAPMLIVIGIKTLFDLPSGTGVAFSVTTRSAQSDISVR